MRAFLLGLMVAGLTAAGSTCPAEDGPTLEQSREQLLRGRYAVARELYLELLDAEPAEAAVGLARSHEAVGDLEPAREAISKALRRQPESARLHAESARLAFERGAYDDASKSAARALELDPDQLLARWIAAEASRVTGKLEEAAAGYRGIVRFYNAHEVKDPDDLLLVALAGAQHARWNRLADQFDLLVNELFPAALEAHRWYWPAHYEAALVWLEKFNRAEAERELKAALAMNPRAAKVHAALAQLALVDYDLGDASRWIDRALEANPRLPQAHRLHADWLVANFQLDEAAQVLEEKALPLNPADEKTLGRLAATYAGRGEAERDKLEKIIEKVTSANAHCGVFFDTLAATLEKRRKYESAEEYYREAIERMPRQVGPRAALGTLLMRLGEEEEARKLLAESFEIDPFNVRVSNTLKVLEVLEDYETLETEHFLIRHDPADRILARYAGKWLEEVYPELCEQLGYEPPEKSLFEIFRHARNTSGHGWFSARMVGLPYLGTVGACAGKMVAMASPTDMPRPFNWGRVLKHEFVHVINLQQTRFNIPHWFTEALAVYNEGYPRPTEWNELLVERFAADDLFDLETINLGFIRPQSGADWHLAYCQAELYAEYMLERFGEDALARMLRAYEQGDTTPDAIRRAFDIEQQDFERGYKEHLASVVRSLTVRPREEERTAAELQRALAENPKDAEAAARLAYVRLSDKAYPQAKRLAEAALENEPRHPLATYVLARLRLLVGEGQDAIKLLEGCLDPEDPEERVLTLLAGLKYRSGAYDEAAKLYRLGRKFDPGDNVWLKHLARVYLRSGDDAELAEALEALAATSADDSLIRKKLAQLALKREDYPEAARWSREALFVDVMDAGTHRMYAEALAAQEKHEAAAEELEVAVELSPEDVALRLELAEHWRRAGRPEMARAALEAALELDPDNDEAQRRLEKLPQ